MKTFTFNLLALLLVATPVSLHLLPDLTATNAATFIVRHFWPGLYILCAILASLMSLAANQYHKYE